MLRLSRSLLALALLLCSTAHAVDVVRYVNTDSTAGGDGTTNATTGANRAYPTLAAWNTAEATNLVSDGDTHTVYCDGTTADTTAVDLTGWTSNSTNTLKILGNTSNRHDGTWTTSAYRLSVADSHVLTVPTACDGIEIGWIQVELTGTFFRNVLLMTGINQSVHHCLIRHANSSTGDAVSMTGDGTGDGHFYNNIVWCTGTGDDGFFGTTGTTWTARCYNNTIYGFPGGINGSYEAVDARNNLVHSDTAGFPAEAYHASSTNNASNQADAPGANAVNGTATYVNAPTDLHLGSADTTAKDAGTDLSAATPSITDDIDGESRSGTYDIGADEVAGSYTIPANLNGNLNLHLNGNLQ